mmetsp:Transcript_30588/g.72819  ORF Transcript_30588/g.72819 Transcript_30588/m.72819 type:complete len:269 (+) Transcript_30588:828-1634(+)
MASNTASCPADSSVKPKWRAPWKGPARTGRSTGTEGARATPALQLRSSVKRALRAFTQKPETLSTRRGSTLAHPSQRAATPCRSRCCRSTRRAATTRDASSPTRPPGTDPTSRKSGPTWNRSGRAGGATWRARSPPQRLLCPGASGCSSPSSIPGTWTSRHCRGSRTLEACTPRPRAAARTSRWSGSLPARPAASPRCTEGLAARATSRRRAGARGGPRTSPPSTGPRRTRRPLSGSSTRASRRRRCRTLSAGSCGTSRGTGMPARRR